MTKLLILLVGLLLILGVWRLAEYWETIEYDRQHYQDRNYQGKNQPKETVQIFRPESLPGMPPQLQSSLEAAQRQGPAALGKWLRTYDSCLTDPRKAWIELDYCVMIAPTQPKEARRIFALIRDRYPPDDSPVGQRIRQLSRSYE
jgi:hypothetical protein